MLHSQPSRAGTLLLLLAAAIGFALALYAWLTPLTGVTGTIGDPQNRAQVVEALRAAGAHVQLTNAAACKLAGLSAAEVIRLNR